MTPDQILSVTAACLLVYSLGGFLTFGYWDERRKSFKYGSEEYENGTFHPILCFVYPLLWIKGFIKLIVSLIVAIFNEFKPSAW